MNISHLHTARGLLPCALLLLAPAPAVQEPQMRDLIAPANDDLGAEPARFSEEELEPRLFNA